jgi:hypothetical protein
MRETDRRIAGLAERQHSLVTSPQLLDLGVSRDEIDYRVENRRLLAVHRGVYRMPGVRPSYEQRIMAACLATGGAASHRSAAALFHLRGFERYQETVEITVEGRAPRLDGVSAHTCGRLLRTQIGIIPVTLPAQTLLDLAHVEPRRAEGALNDALRRELVRLPGMVRWSGDLRNRPGVVRLRHLLEDQIIGGAPTESWLEDRVAEFMRTLGMPQPVRQFRIRLPNGRRLRFDFAIPEQMYAVEADGRLWHTTPADRRRDAERDQTARLLGWTVERVTWLELEEHPAEVAQRLLDPPVATGRAA